MSSGSRWEALRRCISGFSFPRGRCRLSSPAWASELSTTRRSSFVGRRSWWRSVSRVKEWRNSRRSTAPDPAEQYEMKDPRGFAEFLAQLAEHSAKGSALTLRGVQARRPSLFDLVPQLEEMTVP